MSTSLVILLLGGQALTQESGGRFTRLDLVSNVFGRAVFSDSNLMNPWGIASQRDGGPWWVADEGKGSATVYSGEGTPLPVLSPLAVTIPVNPGGVYDDSTPTGVVFNGGDGFELAPDVPSMFIFVTRDGTIAGWSSDVDRANAVPVADNSPEAVYTGAAIAGLEGKSTLYVANFRQGWIEVYDTNFSPILMSKFAFVDPLLPSGYSPYNIQNINEELYVTFAEPRTDGKDAAPGEGFGYVDVFDTKGNLVLRLEHGPWMNAPWAVVLAPAGFGNLGNHLFVGNSGNGRIAVFDPESGSYQGDVMDTRGSALTIPALHGLDFGNNGIAGPATALYFTAGTEEREQNVFGAIIPATTPPLQEPDLVMELAVLR